MVGRESGERSEREARGLIPRAAEELFASIDKAQRNGSGTRFVVFASFLDIHMEQVRDLGFIVQNGGAIPEGGSYATTDPTNLEIYEDSSGAAMAKDLTYIEVKGAAEVLALVKAGYMLKQKGPTDLSSRSHTVITLSVVQYHDGQKPITGLSHVGVWAYIMDIFSFDHGKGLYSLGTLRDDASQAACIWWILRVASATMMAHQGHQSPSR